MHEPANMYELVKRLTFPVLKVEQKAPAPLPGHRQDGFVQVIRPAPAYLQYRLFYWKLGVAAGALAVLILCIALLSVSWWFILLDVAIILFAAFKAALFYVSARLDYEMRWYVVTDRSLLIRQGVWVVREICLTFANAQNVRVKQGPLQRVFGFSSVEVDTAGGGGKKEGETSSHAHRAVLQGLDDPGKVRDLILNLLRRHRTAGLGDPDDHAGAPTAYTPHDLVLLNEILVEAKRLRSALGQEPAEHGATAPFQSAP